MVALLIGYAVTVTVQSAAGMIAMVSVIARVGNLRSGRRNRYVAANRLLEPAQLTQSGDAVRGGDLCIHRHSFLDNRGRCYPRNIQVINVTRSESADQSDVDTTGERADDGCDDLDFVACVHQREFAIDWC